MSKQIKYENFNDSFLESQGLTVTNKNINLFQNQNEEINNIENNQYARVMRLQMENKDLLRQAGALYIGTGYTETVTVFNGTESYEVEIPITAALNPPANIPGATYVLKCTNGVVRWVRQ